METKFCKYCQCEHPLTKAYWGLKRGLLSICLQHDRDRCATYRSKNHDLILERAHNRTADRIQRLRLYRSNYYQNNKQKANEYQARRKNTNTGYQLGCILRKRINNAIHNNHKSGSAVADLGCTIQELKQYLESKFQPGMTWKNYGRHGWHIDHILPLAGFDLTDREQFLNACHYTNLQPLWAEDNLRKGAKHVVRNG